MSTISLGVLVNLTDEPETLFTTVRDFGLSSCQLVSWQPMAISEGLIARARIASEDAGVRISLFWCGYSGPCAWNYIDGPATIGLVPPSTRAMRVEELKRGVDIACGLGIHDVATHVGFLPIDSKDANYLGTVAAIKDIAGYAGEKGVYFNFETGQETPMVLLRCIQDIGLPNLGINLDPANLLMYGNANPLDALDIFGKYVRDVHAKDGEYPVDGYELGVEKPLGEGRVNFPALVAKLKSLHYRGPLTIEREISGPKQNEDIRRAIDILTPLVQD